MYVKCNFCFDAAPDGVVSLIVIPCKSLKISFVFCAVLIFEKNDY